MFDIKIILASSNELGSFSCNLFSETVGLEELSVLNLIFRQRKPESKFIFVNGFVRQNSKIISRFVPLACTLTQSPPMRVDQIWIGGITPATGLLIGWLWVNPKGACSGGTNQIVPFLKSEFRSVRGTVGGQVARARGWPPRAKGNLKLTAGQWDSLPTVRTWFCRQPAAEHHAPQFGLQVRMQQADPWISACETPSREPSHEVPWPLTYTLS